jgi:hypothetical protein
MSARVPTTRHSGPDAPGNCFSSAALSAFTRRSLRLTSFASASLRCSCASTSARTLWALVHREHAPTASLRLVLGLEHRNSPSSPFGLLRLVVRPRPAVRKRTDVRSCPMGVFDVCSVMFKTCRCTGEYPLTLSNMPGVESAARCLARRRCARARQGCAHHRARGGARRGPRERGRAQRRGRRSRSAGTSPDRTDTAGVEATDTRSAEHTSRFNNALCSRASSDCARTQS